MAQAQKLDVKPRKRRPRNKELEQELSWLPARMRKGVLGLVGYIDTPFVVDQETYFEGKRDLGEVSE